MEDVTEQLKYRDRVFFRKPTVYAACTGFRTGIILCNNTVVDTPVGSNAVNDPVVGSNAINNPAVGNNAYSNKSSSVENCSSSLSSVCECLF